MSRTPFLLSDVNFDKPPLPNATATSDKRQICGNVCTYLSDSIKISKKNLKGFEAYFDKYYSSYNLDDDQKILNGLWMQDRNIAPFDLGAIYFVHAALEAGAIDYIDNNKPFYVTWGRFTELSRYWSHVLSQYNVKKGAATVKEKHAISTGTSSVETNTKSVVDAWSRETRQSLSGSIGLDIPFLNASIAGEMSQAETNSGSTTRTTSSQVGMSASQTVEHTFTFEGPLSGEPNPIDLTWWQLCQSARLGNFCVLSKKARDPKRPIVPDGALVIEWPLDGSGCRYAELEQKYDIFEIARSAPS